MAIGLTLADAAAELLKKGLVSAFGSLQAPEKGNAEAKRTAFRHDKFDSRIFHRMLEQQILVRYVLTDLWARKDPYNPYNTSRRPDIAPGNCECGLEVAAGECLLCDDPMFGEILSTCEQGAFSDGLIEIAWPFLCKTCNARFAETDELAGHDCSSPDKLFRTDTPIIPI
jgi:hypothetical protein